MPADSPQRDAANALLAKIKDITDALPATETRASAVKVLAEAYAAVASAMPPRTGA